MALKPDTNFAGKINPATSAYPYGSARNVTVVNDGTGTPFIDLLINDNFGWQQALLDEAGIVPSGSPDSKTTSQYMQAFKKVLAFSGQLVFNSTADFSTGTLANGVVLSDDEVTYLLDNELTVKTNGFYSGSTTGNATYKFLNATDSTSAGYVDGISRFQIRSLDVYACLDVEGKLDVTQLGAVGDGIADDTTPIQEGINLRKNSKLNIPAGVFKITQTLEVGTDGATEASWYCHIQGEGRSTILYIATDSIVGLWFKRTMPGTGVNSWPGYNNRLSSLTIVGINAVNSSGEYIGINSAPTDSITLLKSGGHTTDGDAFNFDCDLAVDNVNLWCANIGWKQYLTHYGHNINIGFEWTNRNILAIGSIAQRFSVLNSRYCYGKALSFAACDSLTISNPTMQVQNSTDPIISILGSSRGVTIEGAYFEGHNGDLIDVYTDNGSAIPSVSIIGGMVIGGTIGHDILCRGGELNVTGFKDVTGNTKIIGTTELGAHSTIERDSICKLNVVYDSNQKVLLHSVEFGGLTTANSVRTAGAYAGTVGLTTNIDTTRRGGGILTITRRTSSSSSQKESIEVFISETGVINYTSTVVSGLVLTDNSGWLHVDNDAGASGVVGEWVYF